MTTPITAPAKDEPKNIEDHPPEILSGRIWAGTRYAYPSLERLVAETKRLRSELATAKDTVTSSALALHELRSQRDLLVGLLREARRFVYDDTLMCEAITRFAPLPAADQAKHDSTPSLSEVLLPKIDAALATDAAVPEVRG